MTLQCHPKDKEDQRVGTYAHTPLYTDRADTAPLVTKEKRSCRAGNPLKWPCSHPFHLQSAFSVQGGGLDPRGPETRLCQPALSTSSNFSRAHPDPFYTKTRTPVGSHMGKAHVHSVQLCIGAQCYPGSAPRRPGPEASAQQGAVALPVKGAGLEVQAALLQCCCCWQSRSPGCWVSLCWSC